MYDLQPDQFSVAQHQRLAIVAAKEKERRLLHYHSLVIEGLRSVVGSADGIHHVRMSIDGMRHSRGHQCRKRDRGHGGGCS